MKAETLTLKAKRRAVSAQVRSLGTHIAGGEMQCVLASPGTHARNLRPSDELTETSVNASLWLSRRDIKFTVLPHGLE
ncbi:MAG: hypothetical protein ACI9W2_004272 [Gammaproteobacteria bacterium]|jgi:hypothetical protein